MRKEWKLYIFLGFMFLLYVMLNYYARKPLNWNPTFHPADKNPYGGFVLFDRISDLFSEQAFSSDRTLYELQDSVGNLLVLGTQGNLIETDLNELIRRVRRGNVALVAAEQFSFAAKDTLQFDTERTRLFRLPNATDTIDVTFGDSKAQLSDVLVETYFKLSDTTKWEVLAQTKRPVLIARPMGDGLLILSSTPLAFTNFGLLQDHRLAEFALKQLPDEPLQFTHYYQTGKIQSSSPFRYVLTEASLTWALYLSLLLIGSLILVDSQRRQRPIKVVQPPKNSTVQFVKTIGALFYRERNNRKIANKLTQYFQEELYKKYHKAPAFTERYYEWLANKTGVSKTHVIQTFQSLQHIAQSPNISDKQLTDLNEQMAAFEL